MYRVYSPPYTSTFAKRTFLLDYTFILLADRVLHYKYFRAHTYVDCGRTLLKIQPL